jgi:hypothetical protein
MTYTPIQNPVDDVELRVEGVMFTVWFALSFICSFLFFLLLASISGIIKLGKSLRKLNHA